MAEAAFYSLVAAAMGLGFLATEAETACMASAEAAASSLSLSLIHFNPFLRTFFFNFSLQGSLLKSNCLLVKILAAAKACQLVATAEASFELCQHQV